MSTVAPDTGASGAVDGTFSPVVASIFNTLMQGIHEGRLRPGERISDGALAEQFQVSRTPVREAIQQLRNLGLVEASASRYTRVATVTPQQTEQAFVVWTALYGVLLDEVADRVPADIRRAMAKDHERFVAELATLDYPAIAAANFAFFGRLLPLSTNPILVDGITRVVHLIRLGSLDLPQAIDVAAVADAQKLLLDALAAADRQLAREALDSIRAIDIPQE